MFDRNCWLKLSVKSQNQSSILVVVAGPSASGKTTFIRQFKYKNRPYLVGDSLQALGLPPDIRFKPMGANSARKLIKRGEALLPTQNNRLIHLDLTSDSCGKHLKFCPIIFSHFKSVHSIQLYLPFEEWLRRIQRRHELGRQVSEYAQQLFELSEFNDQRARKMYRNIYSRWENYLDRKRVHSRKVLDAQNDIVFRCHPKEVRRNPLSCVVHSAICRMPRLSSD